MSDLDRQTSGIHAPEEPEEARELRTSKNQLNDPKAESQWATSGTGEDFQCVHLTYAYELWAEIERVTRENDELEEFLAELLQACGLPFQDKGEPIPEYAKRCLAAYRDADETSGDVA